MPLNNSRYRNRPARKRKFIIVIIAILALAAGSAGALKYLDKDDQMSETNSNSSVQKTDEQRTDSIRLTATGDMLPHSTVNLNAKTGNTYDYKPFFAEVKPYSSAGDVNFCNQEAPSAADLAPAGYPAFNAPPEFSRDMAASGCNLINLANNHSFDKGQAGIKGTLDTWNGIKVLAKAGINQNQTEQNTVAYFETKAVKFAFLSYTICSNSRPTTPYGVNMLEKSLTDKQLPQARSNSDVVIVGVHWCREDVSDVDATQREWSQYFAAQGVDIVFGTGPHFLQPVSKIPKSGGGETVVWFSLGNFLSTQEHINGLVGGVAVMDIDVKTKKISLVGFLPTYMHYEWTPAQKSAGDLLARKNLKIYPLDRSSEPLGRSLHETTTVAQIQRVTSLMNTYTSVPILTSDSFPR